MREFPETPNAENVRYMMIRANYLLASNSIYTKQEERYKNTMKYYEIFVDKYPKSKFDKELASIYKNSTKKLKELENDRYQIKSSRSRS